MQTNRDGDEFELIVDYVVRILCDVTGFSSESVHRATQLDSINIESLSVIAFSAKMEKHFPTISKTFLFDCKTPNDVCAYLLEHHGDAAHKLAADLRQAKAAREPRPVSLPAFAAPEPEWPDLEAFEPVTDAPRRGAGPIAIIGLNGRFPDAPDPGAFWELLANGRDAVREIPASRWPAADFFEEGTISRSSGKSYAKWAGLLADIDRFDAQFFGISARDAAVIDPQERLFLECAWHALEHAGLAGERLDRLRRGHGFSVGVFAGVTTTSYQLLGVEGWHGAGRELPSAMPWSVANRVSYALNFEGPSIAIDTACSSSLVAIHYACESLNRGECDAAVAGGVNVYTHPSKLVQLCQHQMLSPAGRCHSFGKDADGFAPGEGVGAVILKRLGDAIADNDRILAVIRSTSVNHSGRTNGYTVPASKTQAALVVDALHKGGVPPQSIGYFEAHGTGTPLGDPIELAGLAEALHAWGDGRSTGIGSAKSNIGHLESAAGVAGLIKTVLQLQKRALAPSLHSRELNPALGIERTCFFIPQTLTPWEPEPGCGVLRAGVSSIGAGGTGACAVVEEPPAAEIREAPAGPPVFLLSAQSAKQIVTIARELHSHVSAGWNSGQADLTAIAYTLQCCRRHFPHRLAIAANDAGELLEALKHACELGPQSVSGQVGLFYGHIRPGTERAASVHETDEPASLARRWTAGEEIQWAALWRNPPPPADLPRYPFLDERHWVRRSAGAAPVKNSGSAAKTIAIDFSADAPLFSAHRVFGRAVLPATAYLDACYHAARGEGFGGTLMFENLAWITPLILDTANTPAARVRLSRDGAILRFEVSSGGSDANIHFKGRCSAIAEPSARGRLDIENIKSRCRGVKNIADIYARLRRSGLDYGPEFQGLQSVWAGESEALSEVQLPEAPAERRPFNPALLDSALQTVSIAAGLLDESEPRAFIPFNVKRMIVHAELSPRLIAHVADRGGGAKTHLFDCRIASDTGDLLVEMEGVAFHRSTAAANGVDAHPELPATELIEHAWVSEPAARKSGDASAVPETFLVFDAQSALADSLRKKLTGRSSVWQVIPADRFELSGETIHCDVTDDAHLDLLWRTLKADTGLPKGVVFNLTAPWAPGRGVRAAPAWREQALLANADLIPGVLAGLCKAASLPRFHVQVLITRAPKHAPGGHPATAIAGTLKSLRFEAPSTGGDVIELDVPHDAGTLADLVLSEFGAEPIPGVREVRYAGGQRLVKRHRFSVVRAHADSAAGFAPSDVIAVTGGAGAVAGHLMAAIAKIAPVRFALIGRSAPTAAVQSRIAELERLGAKAAYWQADCADRRQLDEALGAIRKEFGPLTGVIHAAGILRDGFLTRQRREVWEEVCEPKIAGALALDAATLSDPLRFFVMCSSLAGICGNTGQSAYAFANAWLDRFAGLRTAQAETGTRQGATISIAWPLWEAEGGMDAPAHVKTWLAQNGLSLLSARTAKQVFLNALATPQPSIIPVCGDRTGIARFFGITGESEAGKTDALASQTDGMVRALETSGDQPAPKGGLDGIISYLNGLISDATGAALHRIDPDSPLEVFGLDSITVAEINVRLEEHFPDLPKTALFEARSIRSLAELIQKEFPQAAAGPAGAGEDGYTSLQGAPLDEGRAASGFETAPMKSGGTDAASSPKYELSRGDIAITGIAGRYAGSKDLAEFWRHLAAGDDLVTEAAGRWDVEHAGGNGIYARWGSFIDGADAFDPLFFGISPRDAERMDPQERLFLQTAWHAVEDAGYTPETLSGPRDGATPRRRVGVIAGVMYGEYQFYGASAGLERPAVTANSSYASIANRVSFCLDFDGPSFAVDSMCSSSLTSIHLACELLRSGGCDIALAGGVNLSVHPYKYRTLCDLKFASADGRCRSFGEGGDGYVPGEGVGVAVLRPLEDAIRSGDHIYAVIKGSDIGHGARTGGYTVPNADAQADVIRRAFARSGADPRRLGYVEAHGTGTSLGDPIEIRGLTKALGEQLRQRKCPIGSLKSNAGHLEAAAGIAAVTKVLLQMKHRQIAPSIHSSVLNPNIDFDAAPFRVSQSLSDWETENGRPRLAAVSSFGAGGSNAHLVLEEFVARQPSADIEREPQLFLLSARTGGQLSAMLARLAAHLRDEPSFQAGGGEKFAPRDVAATLAFGRRHHSHRAAIVARDFPELIDKLTQAAAAIREGGTGQAAATKSGIFSGVLREDGPLPPAGPMPERLAERGELWTAGLIHLPIMPDIGSWRRTPLPGYEFQQRRYWVPNGFAPSAETNGKTPSVQLAPQPGKSAETPALSPAAIIELLRGGKIDANQARSMLQSLI